MANENGGNSRFDGGGSVFGTRHDDDLKYVARREAVLSLEGFLAAQGITTAREIGAVTRRIEGRGRYGTRDNNEVRA